METLSSKCDVMRGKYKVDGEEVTQTYHIIKYTQEREEVSKRRDELEEQIKLALIRVLRTLEKSMIKLNGQNTQFRSSFSLSNEADEDPERKRILEEQMKDAQLKLNSRRAEAHNISEEREAMETAVSAEDRANTERNKQNQGPNRKNHCKQQRSCEKANATLEKSKTTTNLKFV